MGEVTGETCNNGRDGGVGEKLDVTGNQNGEDEAGEWDKQEVWGWGNMWDKRCGEVREGSGLCVWRLGMCNGRYLHSAWSSPVVYLSKASGPGLGPP